MSRSGSADGGHDEAIELACPRCGAKNRFVAERALKDLSSLKCGACKYGLLRVQGQPLVGLDVSQLAHPWDREALDAFKAVPYADKLLKKALGSTVDKLARFNFMASAVKVSARQLPTVHACYMEAAGRLDIDPPPLFITQSPALNAFAIGSGDPTIVVTSGVLDLMGERELVGILGHELTHLKLGHATYRSLATMIANGSLGVLDRFLGIGTLLVAPVRLALMRWYQFAELSADRGELVATGCLETSIRTHMMMAGASAKYVDQLDVAAFIEQADEAERMRESELLVYASEMMDTSSRTHPLPAWRVHHLMCWARTAPFFSLLAGDEHLRLEER